jgi:hypothetical protein
MELSWVDPRDPNYDSDREEAAKVGPGVGGNKTIKLNTLVPEMRIFIFGRQLHQTHRCHP